MPKILGLNEQELREILIEHGRLLEAEQRREQQEAERAAAQEAADEEKRRTSIGAQPLVTVEWVETPQQHSCNIGGRHYRGRGPLRDKANRNIKRRPGSRAQVPACDAVVLAEAGMVEIVDGHEHVEKLWTRSEFAPGIDPGPNPADSEAWERLAV